MLTIGITGGTGCGKTALLRRIAARGGFGIDCDALYYTLLRTDAPLRAALTEAIGEVFLPDGGLDRQRLGACVFSDPAQLERLNQIVFLHVRRAVEALLRREKGVTQEALAQALGVTNQSVSKWESEQCCPDITLLLPLASYFGVTTDMLLGADE